MLRMVRRHAYSNSKVNPKVSCDVKNSTGVKNTLAENVTQNKRDSPIDKLNEISRRLSRIQFILGTVAFVSAYFATFKLVDSPFGTEKSKNQVEDSSTPDH